VSIISETNSLAAEASRNSQKAECGNCVNEEIKSDLALQRAAELTRRNFSSNLIQSRVEQTQMQRLIFRFDSLAVSAH